MPGRHSEEVGGGEMGIVAGSGFIAGAVLGLRFKLLALLPAMLVASVVVGIIAIDSDLWSLVLTLIVAFSSIQVGYLVGAVAGALFEVRTKRDEGGASQSSHAGEKPIGSPH